jgi:hypothetical protein
MAAEYSPRLSIDLTEDQHNKLNRIMIQHGMKKMVFGLIVDDLIAMCDRFGPGEVIGAFTTRVLSLNEICKLNLKPRENREPHGN